LRLVEKGKGPGSHLLSGAMMNPSATAPLYFPDLDESEVPTTVPVDKDTVYLLPQREALGPACNPIPPAVQEPPATNVTSVARLGP
jgi:hypothetical protein